jgi:ParB family chromosome partitioning protein
MAYAGLESDLKHIFGTRVLIKDGKNKKGKIEIEYYSPEELDRLVGILKACTQEVPSTLV